jgi:hypothetical protein
LATVAGQPRPRAGDPTEKRAKGFEPSTFSLEGGRHSSQVFENTSGCDGAGVAPSYSASFSPQNPVPDTSGDPELAAVIAAWAGLPPALRAGIVAMVRAAGANSNGAGAS